MDSRLMEHEGRPLWSLPATALAGGFRRGALDPVAVLAACLARIDRLNPLLNALVFVDRAGALEAAERSRRRWATGKQLSALDGVPVTVKDNMFVAGMPATWGSELFAGFVPGVDETPVARARAAGMIILGKTNTPEFAIAGHTDNRLFGATRNPWDASLTPGGSSGGAVAGLMGGFAPLALATDAGGSIRRPASHVGCLGLKTSVGVVERRHGFPPLANDLQTVGPLARCVDDLAALFDVISGGLHGGEVRRPLRIAAFAGAADCPVDPEVGEIHRRMAARLAEIGHRVEDIAAPYDPLDVQTLASALTAAGLARVQGQHASEWDRKVGEQAARAAQAGSAMSAVEYVAALDKVRDFRWRMHDIFQRCDVLATPTAAALPWSVGQPYPPTIAGEPAGPRSSAIFTAFVNVAGLPAVSLPAGRSAGGLPIGVQFVANHGGEPALIALARQIERRWPWPELAPDGLVDYDGPAFPGPQPGAAQRPSKVAGEERPE